MARPTNFADPAFEPTDEELQQLSHEAFAEVAAQRQAADSAARIRISELRAASLARFADVTARIQNARRNVSR